jgi:predicted GNAT family N-acyltransferase
VDHERRTVSDAEDAKPTSHHFYIGTLDAIQAVLRVRVWGPGQIPDDVKKSLSTARFGEAIESQSVAEMGRFMISKKIRGAGLLLGSVAMGSMRFLVEEMNVGLSFNYCCPGLVPYYRKIGFRPYGGDLV